MQSPIESASFTCARVRIQTNHTHTNIEIVRAEKTPKEREREREGLASTWLVSAYVVACAPHRIYECCVVLLYIWCHAHEIVDENRGNYVRIRATRLDVFWTAELFSLLFYIFYTPLVVRCLLINLSAHNCRFKYQKDRIRLLTWPTMRGLVWCLLFAR